MRKNNKEQIKRYILQHILEKDVVIKTVDAFLVSKSSVYNYIKELLCEGLIEKASDSSTALGFFVDLLERRFGEEFIQKKVEKTFTPVLIGASTRYDGYEKIIEEENQKRAAETRAVKLLRSVVDRFFKEEEENPSPKPEEPKTQRSFLGGLFDRIKTGLK